jgi:hypothetical protein
VVTVYTGPPVVVRIWSRTDGPTEVPDVVEIAETTAGSLFLRTDDEGVLCPAGTWGRIAWTLTR